MSAPVFIEDVGIACALGRGKAAVAAALFDGTAPGMRLSDQYSPGEPATLGMLDGALPDLEHAGLEWRSRSNRLLMVAYQEIRATVERAIAGLDPSRIGVVMGTSTSGVAEAEPAVAQFTLDRTLPPAFHYAQLEICAPARYLAQQIGARGPVFSVSTACTSSAKALASAARLLRAGICDFVVAGGVDALCGLTVAGFRSLGAVSTTRCNPFSRNRAGINIGEGAALFALGRRESEIALFGVGESSDGHHISAPDPTGRGARMAIEGALRVAGWKPGEVDYLNLHGTGTAQNDMMEALLANSLFGAQLPCSSTKPLTGHTLGAAGAIEAALCWLTLSHYNPGPQLPPHLWDGEADPALAPIALWPGGSLAARPRRVLSNSFAFGGSNACVALGTV